ncbi:MAG: translation initiation factor IF-2 [Clostridiales bacterium]|nr:translation initiation factor IF-2 [Clostridiales bacterium]
MNTLFKYRVHEVAKDFGLTSKDISKILDEYATAPKNHMQALTNQELNLIFDYITLNNQVESIEKIFDEALKSISTSDKPSEPERKTTEKTEDTAKKPVSESRADTDTVKEKTAKSPQKAPQKARTDDKKQVSRKPKGQTVKPQPAASAESNVTIQPETVPTSRKKQEVRIIDTSAAEVDLSKYDDKVERLVPESAQKVTGGKQRIKRSADTRNRNANISQKRRQEEQEKMRRLALERQKKQQLKVLIPDEISVGELAVRLKKTGAEVVKTLMQLGTMASLSEIIDFDTAALAAIEFGAKVEREVHITIEERLIDVSEDKEEDLRPRSPVVVVMGHVDHGKTSILDYIRSANVTSAEAGGITQHIGAYTVDYEGNTITFLDTPGHAAFTSMRARGANVTDIAILVVAADDGIMPQTIEAINHAKSADVPIIVAINKMDKPTANPDRIMQQLTEHGLIPEEWGGDTIVCKVSAHTGEGIDSLLEMILLTAEMRELRANPDRRALGTVIEARLDRSRGPVATILIQNGTLNQGDVVIAGKTVGRVRSMTDHKGQRIESAGPSTPVELTGLSEVPEAGDHFNAVEDERMARQLVDERKNKEREEAARQTTKVTLDDLFAQIKEGEIKDLNIVLKTDVQGSGEALKTSLEKLSNDEVRIQVIHSAVGAVSESDILLASAANAIVIGFNVRPENAAAESAKRAGVEIRLYRVIYEAIEEVEASMKGLLAPKYKEELLGQAEVRQVFRASNIGTIAGSYVRTGKIVRGSSVRVVRDGIVIFESTIDSLKRFKDDVREVASNYECGISVEGYTDIKEGDILESFRMVEVTD